MTLSAPLTVNLAVTGKCNLNCKHCLMSETWGGKSDMSTKELLTLIKELEEVKVFNINIFGGEPLMRRDIFQIMEAISKSRIRLSGMNTNATLITREIAKQLKTYGLKRLCVSLDGSTPAVADRMRGKGAFKLAVKGIKNLINEGLGVLISTTVTKYNYRDLTGITLLGKELGVNGVRFNNVFYTGNAICYIKDVSVSAVEMWYAIRTVYKLSNEFNGFITGSYLQLISLIKAAESNPPVGSSLDIPACGAGTSMCTIRPDGWVVPCEIIWDLKAGNVRDEPFVDIWRNSKVMREIRNLFVLSFEDMADCRECIYRSICYRGHRCSPYYLPGGIKAKSLFCLAPGGTKKGLFKQKLKMQ
ncbi:MAG: radical SAM protein [bacterium]|nr:radical SAM protein [bacterium]